MTATPAPLIGAICDDLTGATDLASMLVRGGMQVVQYAGLPTPGKTLTAADALVIALKSRSIPKAEAVEQSLDACRFLKKAGVRQVYFKYCSTFDSTPQGNIGPVAEALRAELGAANVPHLPSLPVNGRTVYQGHLFVNGQLLSETGMATHPLTPMTDPDLVRVLQAQTPAPVGKIAWPLVAQGAGAIGRAMADSGCRHLIGDAISDADLTIWADALRDAPLVAGGSGLAQPLARAHLALAPSKHSAMRPAWPTGPTLILAGSCSTMTRAQIASYKDQGGPCLPLDLALLLHDPARAVGQVMNWIAEHQGAAPLVYSSAASDQRSSAGSDQGKVAYAIEDAFGDIARRAVAADRAHRLVVAGGETSGAVVRSLGATALRIGPEIAPGVPWTEALDARGAPICALALKSGNFGDEDFFLRALAQQVPA